MNYWVVIIWVGFKLSNLHYSIICYWFHFLKISQLDYMFYIFLIYMLIFMSTIGYLPFNPITYLLCYKNLNLNNWLMKWLSIFNYLEILQVWRIYEDGVIQW